MSEADELGITPIEAITADMDEHNASYESLRANASFNLTLGAITLGTAIFNEVFGGIKVPPRDLYELLGSTAGAIAGGASPFFLIRGALNLYDANHHSRHAAELDSVIAQHELDTGELIPE